MTEDEETGNTGMIDLESKFWRTTLLIVSVVLIFAGPTYVPYVLNGILNLDYIASIVTGIVLLTVGLLMMWYLIRKKVIV
ncbi:MAG TPA: hypothetical protein VJL33_04850 [Candidatus Bathyarchaeia archaeon]|nr:hypothetical protein [Candidatus Bathyarchaeia archaeon]